MRKVFDVENADIRSPIPELSGKSLLDALLTPTKIYVKAVTSLFDKVDVRGVSHITGGGFYENIPRALGEGKCAKIEKSAVRVLPVFSLISKKGGIEEREMFNTFNMGVGMCVTVKKDDADRALELLREAGEQAYVLGEIAQGEGVKLC